MSRLIVCIVLFLLSNGMFAQKLRVESFTPVPTDLTARKQPRQDLNGKPCAVVKVQVADGIVGGEGYVGNVAGDDMEKFVYVTSAAPRLVLKFREHYPLTLTFADYGMARLDGGSTYVLMLAEGTRQSVESRSASGSAARGLSADGIDNPVIANIVRNMVYVEGGTFTMGTDSRKATEDERNQHSVTLSDFYICKYEVTQEEWKAVMGVNPSAHNFADITTYPVDNVSWDDCQRFIARLNELTGLKFRLPTEAEWEYAARGGKQSRGYKYAGSNKADDVAWYYTTASAVKQASQSGLVYSSPVGKKLPNELGLYDMSGNVYEWCADWWEPYDLYAKVNPKGPAEGTFRCKRGGCWDGEQKECSVWSRGYEYPHGKYSYLGLRLAM